ncbi:angiotensin-converting enzyme [Caerostris darwini]|uniref:Angiotensin-converting enzyme n=1 Tax=Caerostris darwini TaxID=1538125 RepID=A0AAV4TBC6_9ARAC|nr:angiotensin-converting enzyme [Caerostris darwini]
MISELLAVMGESRDPEELKYYWVEYRKATGRKYRHIFSKAIEEENKWAKNKGYENKGKYNLASYEDENFLHNAAKEIEKILPFYKQLHAYVRTKLIQFYPNVTIKPDGPIPAHLFGDMYGQEWDAIFPIVEPYPNRTGLFDVTDVMKEKKMKAIDMFIMAEDFFTSMGLMKMKPHFWRYSQFQKPKHRNMSCLASAFDFYDGKDYRIQMCAEVDADSLETIYHEMGHIEYYMHYAHLPQLFRESANPGFHEAIGDTISLSISNPEYLRSRGLSKEREVMDEKDNINYLMYIALRYAVTINYAYIIDHWRIQVYNGSLKSDHFNEKYWHYRKKYQGLCPPVKRTEKDFDIGAKHHIAFNVEYFRYFVANILQFQIYKTLCNEANYEGLLHKCNIYGNKNAGKALGRLLREGKSKPWQEILSIFSNNMYNKLDSSAMLEYFEPLKQWLKKKNKGEFIGWKSKDSMSCPR